MDQQDIRLLTFLVQGGSFALIVYGVWWGSKTLAPRLFEVIDHFEVKVAQMQQEYTRSLEAMHQRHQEELNFVRQSFLMQLTELQKALIEHGNTLYRQARQDFKEDLTDWLTRHLKDLGA